MPSICIPRHEIRRRIRVLLVYAPLVAHIAPTLIIGFGFVIPGSPIEGINEYTIGFVAAVVGFVPAYVSGISVAKKLGAAAS